MNETIEETTEPEPEKVHTDEESSSSPTQTSTEKVFAWVGFLLINAAFGSLISWGYFQYWVIGFVVDIIYLIVLLLTGFWLRRRNGGKDSVLTSLIFLLSIIAMAVAGLYIPLYVLPCSVVPSNYSDDNYHVSRWVTDTKNLPSDVKTWWEAWWEDDDYYNSGPSSVDYYNSGPSSGPSFVHLGTTGVTLFRGEEEGQRGYMYTVQDGQAPERKDSFYDPQYFTVVDNATACFAFGDRREGPTGDRKLACTDGVEYVTTLETFVYADGIFYSNDLLWFRTGTFDPWGNLLYSADPNTLSDVTLHTSLTNSTESSDDASTDNNCTDERTVRIRSLSWTFLSALPALLAALAIYFFHKVPTMPIGTYLTGTWMVVCCIYSINPGFDREQLLDFFNWWSTVTAGLWLVVLTLEQLTNRISRSRLGWSSNFASLVYTVGTYSLVILSPLFRGEDPFWRWAVLTGLTVPLLFLTSVITGQILLMILAAIVIMIDVWRLTDYIATVADWDYIWPVHFAVLGLSGIALGFLGYVLSKRQSQMKNSISSFVKSKLSRWVIEPKGGEGTNNNEIAADEVATA